MPLHSLRFAFLARFAVFIAGCDSAPPLGDPTPRPITHTATANGIKTVNFTWTAIDEAPEFRLSKDLHGYDGCTAVSTVCIDGLLTSLIKYVKSSNAGEDDQFGPAVALSASGTTLAVGAFGQDSDAAGVDGLQRCTARA